MNGESPMIRAGLGIAQRRARDHGQQRDRRRARRACPRARSAGPRASASGVTSGVSSAVAGPSPPSAGSYAPRPVLDELRRDDRQHDRDEDRRADAEVEVGGEVDVRVRRRAGRVVRDLGQDAVERRDQEVHAEARGHAGERGRDAGERVSADALERGRAQGYQHEVAGVGGDARDHAEQDDDERQRAREDTPTSLRISAAISPAASARPTPIITTRMIATAAKLLKFVDERREEEAHAVGGQQALDLRRLRHELVVVGGSGSVGPT